MLKVSAKSKSGSVHIVVGRVAPADVPPTRLVPDWELQPDHIKAIHGSKEAFDRLPHNLWQRPPGVSTPYASVEEAKEHLEENGWQVMEIIL